MKSIQITTDPQSTNKVKVLQENNYYPFGLQHGGYNKDVKEIDFDEYLHLTNEQLQNLNADELLSILPVIKNKYKYKYQGQERQDELGLNWYSFKWRNYMSDIGRFFNPDPLSEKYSFQSHYNFSENRVVDGIELEGLEFLDADDARVEIRRGGGVHLKFSSMLRLTKNKFHEVNNNPNNWTHGSFGINTQIDEFNLNSLISTLELVRGKQEQGVKIERPIAKSTGKSDKRYKNRMIGNVQISNTNAKGLIIVEGIRFSSHVLAKSIVKFDQMKVDNHLKMLNEDVFTVMYKASYDGALDNYNENDILNITNIVLQGEMMLGEDFNQELYDIGIHIYNYYTNENYRNTFDLLETFTNQNDSEIQIKKNESD